MAVTWRKVAYEADVITKALLTTTGDMIYASAASTPARLGIGSDNQVMIVNTNVPNWEALPASPAHNTSHENGGGDEISVAGLSGELADDQPPKHHASTHHHDGDDTLALDELGVPDAAVAFNGQQATNFIDHIVADATARLALTAVVGKRVFQTDELAEYVCTVAV